MKSRIITLIIIFLIVSTIFSAIPNAINFQGKLMDSSNIGITDTLDVTVRLFDEETEGELLWEQIHSDVVISKGLFSLILDDLPDTLNFASDYYLETIIDEDTILPRQRLTSTPYAYRSEFTNNAIQSVYSSANPERRSGNLMFIPGSGATLTESSEGDSIMLIFSLESEGSSGGDPGSGFSFTNPYNVDCYPTRATIRPGLKVSAIVSAVLADPEFSDTVAFAATGLPDGATVTFTPDLCIPTNTIDMIIETDGTTPIGSYPITIEATSGDNIARTLFTLVLEMATFTWNQYSTSQFDENTNVNVQTTGDQVWLGMLDLGNGIDSDFHATSNMNLSAGTYNFNNFRIDPGVTVTVERGTSTPLIIRCLGEVVISGWLDLNGNNGNNYSGASGGTGGFGGPAGYSGGNGGNHGLEGEDGSGPGFGGKGGINGYYGYWGGGGGYGTSGDGSSTSYYGNSGSVYGDPQITILYGGSGGGGGAGSNYSSYTYGGGGGGGGGGALMMSAQKITINSGGGIRANGGRGGNAYTGQSYNRGGGGGGSGGSIWLRAEKIINTGNMQANGGSYGSSYTGGFNGGYGRIRMDCVSYEKSHPFYSDGSISPDVGWSELPDTYLPNGYSTTYVIAPTGLKRWGILEYTKDVSMSGTSLTVDVLDETESTLLSDVPSGTDLHLAGIDAETQPSIRIRASLSTSNFAYSPKLLDWQLTYFTE